MELKAIFENHLRNLFLDNFFGELEHFGERLNGERLVLTNCAEKEDLEGSIFDDLSQHGFELGALVIRQHV